MWNLFFVVTFIPKYLFWNNHAAKPLVIRMGNFQDFLFTLKQSIIHDITFATTNVVEIHWQITEILRKLSYNKKV